jgi:hypothetical protein
MKKYIYSVLTLFLLVGFQNCGKPVNFSNSDSIDDKVTTAADGDLTDVPIPDDAANHDNDPGTGNVNPDPSGEQKYVCVVNGFSGQSHKIVYIGGTVDAENSTMNDVCMTYTACTDIISAKFDVRRPSFRGFCNGHNPHVVHFNDAQIADLVSRIP